MTPDPRDRLLDLLTDEATQGLSPAEGRELAELLAAFPDEDADSLALAAAAADLALSGPPAPLPPDLAAKLERTAAAVLPRPPEPRRPTTPWSARAGWVVAAGLAGVLVWTNRPQPVPDPAAEFARLDREPGTQKFVAGPDGNSGRVVWDEARQEGYLEVRGLEPNDPAVAQYQLWIVDPAREQPVDGGVFDVRPGPDGRAVVPVRAALRVSGAKAFAVTREKPGGVVVSKGPMLVVLAPA